MGEGSLAHDHVIQRRAECELTADLWNSTCACSCNYKWQLATMITNTLGSLVG